ncbi:hypothetical protein E3N88_27207 [Mikania micrantha]|uniref:Alanyl-transfer RNA synthetases family profile domain-containing protein n=1 Tax=Mikania micrantha TaxID=192012 RepID=A0A5N6MWW6_9ASTR|nr:hypothetical protein E3N88_27207 [Mikania micrantha]
MDPHQTPATPTVLLYHHDMFNLQSTATLISSFLDDDGRHALILDSTVFHPQGGGQPADTGLITDVSSSRFKFFVQDVRSRNGIVYHYGVFEKTAEDLEGGVQVVLSVDESRRKLNSRLHSAGHLLDVCLPKVGLSDLKPGKAYHFPDGYENRSVPNAELHSKELELELEANNLISRGMKVSVDVYSYEEAAMMCGGALPDYIPKGSTPRIVKLGDFPGCPCGGTHVSNISDLVNIKKHWVSRKLPNFVHEAMNGTVQNRWGHMEHYKSINHNLIMAYWLVTYKLKFFFAFFSTPLFFN